MISLLMAASLSSVSLSDISKSYESLSEAELKQYFWVCDKASSQYMMDDGDGAVCSHVYEQLKNRVFKGDNNALLEWWRSERQTASAK